MIFFCYCLLLIILGYCVDFIVVVFEQLGGFKYIIRFIKSLVYGVKVNGMWMGMIVEFVNGVILLVLILLFLSELKYRKINIIEFYMIKNI